MAGGFDLVTVVFDPVVHVQPVAPGGVQPGRRLGEGLRPAGAGARARGGGGLARLPLQGGDCWGWHSVYFPPPERHEQLRKKGFYLEEFFFFVLLFNILHRKDMSNSGELLCFIWWWCSKNKLHRRDTSNPGTKVLFAGGDFFGDGVPSAPPERQEQLRRVALFERDGFVLLRFVDMCFVFFSNPRGGKSRKIVWSFKFQGRDFWWVCSVYHFSAEET